MSWKKKETANLRPKPKLLSNTQTPEQVRGDTGGGLFYAPLVLQS